MNESRSKQKMSDFALSFPCLRRADGVSPWDALRLDEWATDSRSHGERCTAQFVLAIWSGTPASECQWKVGPFDLLEALRVWDEDHHRAFLSWARAPWWP
jgi:hypothetical protein